MIRFFVAIFSVLLYMVSMAQYKDIQAVDVHSHLMTKPYLECLDPVADEQYGKLE